MAENDTRTSLRFAPSILTRLGEELVPHLDQAIVELVRNSYDADATLCRITLTDTADPGGTIVIEDNGSGMDLEGIRDGWLVLGGSSKKKDGVTKLGRHVVGDKGLGRLAALRAGRLARLSTRFSGQLTPLSYEVSLDWDKFDAAKVVEEVPIEVQAGDRSEPGTTISLENLRKSLPDIEVERLTRSLVLLTSPFEGETNFRVQLLAPGYPELEARVQQGYLNEAEFRLTASLGEDRKVTASVYDWKGSLLFQAHSDTWFPKRRGYSPTYEAPLARFELYNYVLRREGFTGRDVTIKEVQDWLRVVGGVHFYHRRFRVSPYGDPGHDWLDMNLARARSPEERPSTNNSIGRVIVDDPDGVLVQKTDRIGFIESPQFLEIRRFARDTLEWFARERLRAAERRREVRRTETKEEQAEARVKLESQIKGVMSEPEAKKALAALSHLDRAYTRTLDANREELMLYRALATAGTTAAVFAHEIGKPINTISASQKSIRHRIRDLRPKRLKESLSEPLNLIVRAADRLKKFAGMQLDILRREKRRTGSVDVHQVLRALEKVWSPILSDSKVTLLLELDGKDDARIHGTEALLETVATNCLTNVVRAFETAGARRTDRKAVIRTRVLSDDLVIEVEDNGPGIEIPIDDVWLPGRTTHAGGTGFGLTIVKDSVLDLSGSYEAEAHGGLGGALFRFTIPRIVA